VEPVNHVGEPKKPPVTAHESEDEVSPKAGVAGSNPAGGTTKINRLTCTVASRPDSRSELRTGSWSYPWSQLGLR